MKKKNKASEESASQSQSSAQDQEVIAKCAYYIWEQEGCPDGRHEDHWSQAVSQLV